MCLVANDTAFGSFQGYVSTGEAARRETDEVG